MERSNKLFNVQVSESLISNGKVAKVDNDSKFEYAKKLECTSVRTESERTKVINLVISNFESELKSVSYSLLKKAVIKTSFAKRATNFDDCKFVCEMFRQLDPGLNLEPAKLLQEFRKQRQQVNELRKIKRNELKVKENEAKLNADCIEFGLTREQILQMVKAGKYKL